MDLMACLVNRWILPVSILASYEKIMFEDRYRDTSSFFASGSTGLKTSV